MRQLSLFDAEEFYEFPKDLVGCSDHFLTIEEANRLKAHLFETAHWKQRTQKMYDKTVITPRLTAWYGDRPKSYQSGGSALEFNYLTPELRSLKERIENELGYQFNGCE